MSFQGFSRTVQPAVLVRPEAMEHPPSKCCQMHARGIFVCLSWSFADVCKCLYSVNSTNSTRKSSKQHRCTFSNGFDQYSCWAAATFSNPTFPAPTAKSTWAPQALSSHCNCLGKTWMAKQYPGRFTGKGTPGSPAKAKDTQTPQSHSGGWVEKSKKHTASHQLAHNQ